MTTYALNCQSGKNDHKQRLLYEQNTKLERVIQFGNEADNLGRDIKVNLDGQTAQMRKAQDNTRKIGGELAISNRLLNIIKKNEMKNKITLYCVIFFLLVSIGLIVYFKFFTLAIKVQSASPLYICFRVRP